MKPRIWSDIGVIIQAGIDGDEVRVERYAELLARHLEEIGDTEHAAFIRKCITPPLDEATYALADGPWFCKSCGCQQGSSANGCKHTPPCICHQS